MGCDSGYVEWIHKVFGECVITPRDKWSFGVGMFSNLIWLISSTPQYIQNCKTKHVDGQSPFFFSLLFSGNVFSLIGLLINGGLVVQIIQAIIYVILDGILFSQYIYYRCCFQECCVDQMKKNKSDARELSDENDEIMSPSMAGVAAAAVLAAVDYAYPYRKADLVGTLFGWASAAIYISSRIPQVIKNFKDRTVGDLSPMYVIFAVLGNGTYLMSIFIKSLEPQFCWNQMPWIVGAGGPCLCDITFLFQMCCYGLSTSASSQKFVDQPEEEQEEDDNDAYIGRITEL